MNPEIEKILKRALVGLKMGADLAYATETTDSQAAMAGAVCVKIESIEEEAKAFLRSTLETQDVPGNPGCTIFFNRPNMETMHPNLPTKAGFFWWRKEPSDEWRMIQIVDWSNGEHDGTVYLSAYDVECHDFGGRTMRAWSRFEKIGEWIAIPKPEHSRHNAAMDLPGDPNSPKTNSDVAAG